MPLLLYPFSVFVPPPPMAAVASPPPAVTIIPSVSTLDLQPLPPPPATDDFHWLDLFAFLNSPADSYQIPPQDEDELEALRLELELELEKEAEMDRARKAQHRRLRQRQVKAETWARAAEEYREIERKMLDRRLAPALPYVKSLFVGWFEPLRDAIARDQDVQRRKRVKHVYAKYLLLLPADKVAVIVMHKMMGLLMSSKDGSGSVRVVQAAHCIGEAVEREFKVQAFFQKSRKKGRRKDEGENDPALEKEQAKCRKRVKSLVKRRKLSEAQKLVQQEIELEEWGTEAQVKLGTRLIELLLDSAFVQSPADQSPDSYPDFRPAFKHVLRQPIVENGKLKKKHWVIECDPLVHEGFESTIRTSLQCLALRREGDVIAIQRQKAAFPPNFVHSLDSSHMMMTAIACKEAGLHFAGVHDSFWVHACNVDQMNQILREQFVELYSMPILENLLEEFQTLFPTLEFPPCPPQGNFDPDHNTILKLEPSIESDIELILQGLLA